MSRLLRKGAEHQVSCDEARLARSLGTRDLSASAQAFIFPVSHHTWHLGTPFFHPAQGLSPQELHRWSYPEQNCSRVQACLDHFLLCTDVMLQNCFYAMTATQIQLFIIFILTELCHWHSPSCHAVALSYFNDISFCWTHILGLLHYSLLPGCLHCPLNFHPSGSVTYSQRKSSAYLKRDVSASWNQQDLWTKRLRSSCLGSPVGQEVEGVFDTGSFFFFG